MGHSREWKFAATICIASLQEQECLATVESVCCSILQYWRTNAMVVKARIRGQASSSPSSVVDVDDCNRSVQEFDEAVFGQHDKEKPKHHTRKRWCPETRVRIFGCVLTVLAMIFLRFAWQQRQGGPPSSLVVVGRRSVYEKVPEKFRRRFYVDDDNKFRRTVIRAFRNRGWKKANKPEEAQFIYDKRVWRKRFDQLKPWQRYSHYPDFDYWDEKDYFVEGFQKYYSNHPEEPNMLPETYILDTNERRHAFQTRLESGGYDEPWVLKVPYKNNGSGITMLGPNSDELHSVDKRAKKHLKEQEDEDEKSRLIVQSYICNELTWYRNHKFDLRFYWMVASVDPLIVLYHDGYVRVGNAAYDETDWSSTRQHLTTHTYLADEEKGTMDQLEGRIREHYSENKRKLAHIHIDPVQHVRNQFKTAISQTAATFKDVTLGNDVGRRNKAENAYQHNGADFVIDNNLDVWYIEAQAGPGMEEEWDFRVEMHADLLRSMIDTVEEIQLKQEADPKANLLPLTKLGNWEIVYAGDWQYHYEGYQRPVEKSKCSLAPGVKSGSSVLQQKKGRSSA